MRLFVTFNLILTMGYFSILPSCKKESMDPLKSLYSIYQNGEIYECKLEGKLVYRAGINAYDAGNLIYDKEGNQIGTCNYGWGKPDSICSELNDCEIIYRVNDNIWGNPAVDKYNLNK